MDHDAPSPRQHALIEALRDLATMVREPATAEEILRRTGDWAEAVLPVDGVGVLLRDGWGGLIVATASNELGEEVEALEAELGEGPCSHSMATGQLIRVPDLLKAEERYPHFVPKAVAAGVRSVHAVPMSFRSELIGSLDLISRQPMALSPDELAVAQLLADVTISYLANSRLLEEISTTAANLQYALDSRVSIEQAKGILAERHGIGVDEAFHRMRAHARSTSTKLIDVAAQVAAGDLQV
jgi:GAF domain-containing protein